MAGPAINIPAGTTSALTFQLLESGIAINLTAITVTLLLTGSDGIDVLTGTVAVSDAPNGKVTYTPTATGLDPIKSPYKARWKLVDGGGLISYVPTGYRDTWNVVKA
jgi:hypothetical protein